MPENHFRRHAFDSKIIQSAVVTTGSFIKEKSKRIPKKMSEKEIKTHKTMTNKKKERQKDKQWSTNK